MLLRRLFLTLAAGLIAVNVSLATDSPTVVGIDIELADHSGSKATITMTSDGKWTVLRHSEILGADGGTWGPTPDQASNPGLVHLWDGSNNSIARLDGFNFSTLTSGTHGNANVENSAQAASWTCFSAK